MIDMDIGKSVSIQLKQKIVDIFAEHVIRILIVKIVTKNFIKIEKIYMNHFINLIKSIVLNVVKYKN